MLHPQVPVHTISFNCADKEANEFLYQLAKDTGGRYHYYNEDGILLDGPEPWEVGGFINIIFLKKNCSVLCKVHIPVLTVMW